MTTLLDTLKASTKQGKFGHLTVEPDSIKAISKIYFSLRYSRHAISFVSDVILKKLTFKDINYILRLR